MLFVRFWQIKESKLIIKLNYKTYDILCWIGRIVMPSLAVLYTILGDIWCLPLKRRKYARKN